MNITNSAWWENKTLLNKNFHGLNVTRSKFDNIHYGTEFNNSFLYSVYLWPGWLQFSVNYKPIVVMPNPTMHHSTVVVFNYPYLHADIKVINHSEYSDISEDWWWQAARPDYHGNGKWNQLKCFGKKIFILRLGIIFCEKNYDAASVSSSL